MSQDRMSLDYFPVREYKAQTGGKGSLYTQGTYGLVKNLLRWNWLSVATDRAGSMSCYTYSQPWATSADQGFRVICGTLKKSV